MQIVSKRRAMSVVAFSTQSLRRSVSRALSFAIASFVRARRLEPRSAVASRCCRTFNRLASPQVRPGRSGEKVVHSLGEVPQRLLLHRLRPGRQPIMLGAGRGQLRTLLVVAWRTPTRLPMLLLLGGQIPHISGVATMLGQHDRLFSGGEQPVSRHTGNVTATADKSPKGEAAPPPPA